MISAFFLGGFLSFVSAIPVAGPVSALIVSDGFRGRFAKARWIAVGAGLAEGFYTLLAIWGFHTFLSQYAWIGTASKWAAGLILVFLGLYFFKSKKLREVQAPLSPSQHTSTTAKSGAFVTGLLVSLINPTLIATWTTTITLIHGLQWIEFNRSGSMGFALGVWFGIVAWFSLFLRWMKVQKQKLSPTHLDRTLQITGTVLLGLGAWLCLRAGVNS
jgi:threonine/homoserine/homoserine lactone efflux protein